MATRETRLQRGRRRAQMLVSRTMREVRETRLVLGLSQRSVAGELGISQAAYAKFEVGKVAAQVERISEVASILGMEISLGLHPIGDPIRDKGQQALIGRFRGLVGQPWRVVGQEVGLPISGDGRAWDVLLRGGGQSVGVECETRVRDIQALARRMHLRERDSGVDWIVVVLADSATNRRLVGQLSEALGERYATSPRQLLRELRDGARLTAGGVVLI